MDALNIECKITAFASFYIPRNMDIEIDEPDPNNSSKRRIINLKLQKIDFKTGSDLINLHAQIKNELELDDSMLQKFSQILEEKNKAGHYQIIKIEISPFNIFETILQGKINKTPGYAYMCVLGFIIGDRIEPLLIIYYPKNKKPIEHVKETRWGLDEQKLEKSVNRWKQRNFYEFFSQNFTKVLDNFNTQKNIRDAIEFYCLAMPKSHHPLCFVEYVAAFDRLKNLNNTDCSENKKKAINDFEKNHNRELYKYRQIRDKFLHGGEFIQMIEMKNNDKKEKISVDYDKDLEDCKTLLEDYILTICNAE